MKSSASTTAAALALIIAAGAVQAEGERKGEPGQPRPGSDAERTAVHANPATALVLSDAERAVVLDSVGVHGESTLALGFLTVGADVPRSVELKGFPQAVLDKVSKLKDYKYFSAEGRIAIVDPHHAKVEMVIEPRR